MPAAFLFWRNDIAVRREICDVSVSHVTAEVPLEVEESEMQSAAREDVNAKQFFHLTLSEEN